MPNYATKSDLKYAIDVNTSQLVEKDDLADLKSEVDKLDINELKNVPTSLSSLKSKIDKLDVNKLKPVSVVLKKLIDVVF